MSASEIVSTVNVDKNKTNRFLRTHIHMYANMKLANESLWTGMSESSAFNFG